MYTNIILCQKICYFVTTSTTFFMINALLLQNFVDPTYALFPPIFWGWKLESANFFAFWLYDIIYIYYWVSQYSKYPIWDALPSPFMNKDREKAGGINICKYQYSTAHKYGINIYVNINIVLVTCTTSIYVNINIVLLAWLRVNIWKYQYSTARKYGINIYM